MLTRKIMLLGDIAVGKTSLARRLVFNQFDVGYKATLGVDIYTHQVALPSDADGDIKLSIWDVDGDLAEGIFSHNYIRGASGALIIGDVTRPATMNTMLRLSDTFRETLVGRPFVYVVNKSDVMNSGEDRAVPEGLNDPEATLHFTSALTGDNVGDAFVDLAQAIVRTGA